MNIWTVEFQQHYTDMEKGEWDDDLTDEFDVVASDYDSALETARAYAMACSFVDAETDKEVFVDDVRLVSITKGKRVQAIERMKA